MEHIPANDNVLPETVEALTVRARDRLASLIARAEVHGCYDDPAPGERATFAFSLKHVEEVVSRFDEQTTVAIASGVIARIEVLNRELTRIIERNPLMPE